MALINGLGGSQCWTVWLSVRGILKKLNKSETRNIALTRFVKETTRNQIYLKNGQSITFYDAIMNKLSPEDKTMVRKTMDLEGNKNNRNR